MTFQLRQFVGVMDQNPSDISPILAEFDVTVLVSFGLAVIMLCQMCRFTSMLFHTSFGLKDNEYSSANRSLLQRPTFHEFLMLSMLSSLLWQVSSAWKAVERTQLDPMW